VVAVSLFLPDVDLAVDPGIRDAVIALRRGGIETIESCEGGPGHAFPDPTVKFVGSSWAGYRALAIAMENRLPVLRMQFVYGVNNGHLEGPWWELVFRTTGQASS